MSWVGADFSALPLLFGHGDFGAVLVPQLKAQKGQGRRQGHFRQLLQVTKTLLATLTETDSVSVEPVA